jgi:predicted patatin/cPLA2 family phospholipase
MIFEGSHKVIQAIQEKKRLMDAGQPHDHIRPLLYQGGGLMCGAYGVGAALALEDLGYQDCFDYLVGVSSGALITAHFASGTTNQGQRLLPEDCCDSDFINPFRFWNQVDTKKLIQLLKTHPEKGVSPERILAHRSQVYFGVTDYVSAKPRLLEAKKGDYLFQSIHASINMQNVSPYKIVIDGTHYTDGGFASPHVIAHAVTELQPTHALIITNNNREFKKISRFERFLNNFVFRLRLNGILARAINGRGIARDEAIARIMEGEAEVAVVWGDGSIGSTTRDSQKITSVVHASRTWWHGLFSLEK